MDEGRVNHAVCFSGAASQAVEIFKSAAMDVSSRGCERLRTCVGADQAEHLMARAKKLADDSGADESRGAGDEDTHANLLFRR